MKALRLALCLLMLAISITTLVVVYRIRADMESHERAVSDALNGVDATVASIDSRLDRVENKMEVRDAE